MAVTTDANGGTTTTDIQGRSIPTLVYNCAYMPFICKNIQNHIDNKKHYKFDSQGLMKLHVDYTEVRGTATHAKERRKPTCEGAGNLYRKAGFPKKCADISKLTNINTLYSNVFPQLPVESVPKQPALILGPADPQNPNDKTKNQFSGLQWTCDEFPSARYVKLLSTEPYLFL